MGLLLGGGALLLVGLATGSIILVWMYPGGGARGTPVTAADLDQDNRAEVVVGSGAGQPSAIKVYPGKAVVPGPEPTSTALDPFGTSLTDGVFVG